LAQKPLSRKAISDNKPITSDVIKPFCPIPAIAASLPCVLATWSSSGPTVVGLSPTKRTVEVPGSEAGTVSSQDSFEFLDVMEEKRIDKRALGRHKEGDDGWTAGCDDMVRSAGACISSVWRANSGDCSDATDYRQYRFL
jgi:hypothetical protein